VPPQRKYCGEDARGCPRWPAGGREAARAVRSAAAGPSAEPDAAEAEAVPDDSTTAGPTIGSPRVGLGAGLGFGGVLGADGLAFCRMSVKGNRTSPGCVGADAQKMPPSPGAVHVCAAGAASKPAGEACWLPKVGADPGDGTSAAPAGRCGGAASGMACTADPNSSAAVGADWDGGTEDDLAAALAKAGGKHGPKACSILCLTSSRDNRGCNAGCQDGSRCPAAAAFLAGEGGCPALLDAPGAVGSAKVSVTSPASLSDETSTQGRRC